METWLGASESPAATFGFSSWKGHAGHLRVRVRERVGTQTEKVLTCPARANRDKHTEEGKAGGVKSRRACGETGQLDSALPRHWLPKAGGEAAACLWLDTHWQVESHA